MGEKKKCRGRKGQIMEELTTREIRKKEGGKNRPKKKTRRMFSRKQKKKKHSKPKREEYWSSTQALKSVKTKEEILIVNSTRGGRTTPQKKTGKTEVNTILEKMKEKEKRNKLTRSHSMNGERLDVIFIKWEGTRGKKEGLERGATIVNKLVHEILESKTVKRY